jgi:hypothetical protein
MIYFLIFAIAIMAISFLVDLIRTGILTGKTQEGIRILVGSLDNNIVWLNWIMDKITNPIDMDDYFEQNCEWCPHPIKTRARKWVTWKGAWRQQYSRRQHSYICLTCLNNAQGTIIYNVQCARKAIQTNHKRRIYSDVIL